jgi:CDP-diacylglycerol--glycerol-3-phosphate 3-phosphatidyltransferase
MSALREWAASIGPEARDAVAVSSLGKVKTAAQMSSLALLLSAHGGTVGALGGAAAVTDAGMALLGIAAGLTVWSLIEYFSALWRWF